MASSRLLHGRTCYLFSFLKNNNYKKKRKDDEVGNKAPKMIPHISPVQIPFLHVFNWYSIVVTPISFVFPGHKNGKKK